MAGGVDGDSLVNVYRDSELNVPYDDILFTELRENGMIFFDFSSYIPLLLQTKKKNMLITRPSRFGKSLFLDALATFIDCNTSEEEFRAAFGGTAVLPADSMPLPEGAMSCSVLRMSLILDVSDTDPVALQDQLGRVILRACRQFILVYKLPKALYNKALFAQPMEGIDILRDVADYMIASGRDLFILIDEYDRFANELMLKSPDLYSRLVSDGTANKTSSPLTQLYSVLELIAQGAKLPKFRSLSMGITPIALADASGPNTIADLTRTEAFANILGATEPMVRRVLHRLPLSINEDQRRVLLDRMREYYNGFCFYGGSELLFHPKLCIYLFEQLTERGASSLEKLTSPFTGCETLLALMDCPDVGLSEYALSFMIGQPQLRNALLMGGMLDLPNHRGVMSLAARREVSMPFGAFKQKLLFANILSSSSQSAFGSPQDRVRLYLYFHGVLSYVKTFTRDNEDRVALRVPNLTAISKFSGELHSLIEERVGDIIGTVLNPTEDGVKRLVASLIQNPGGVAKQQSWTETSFQSSITGYLLGAAKNSAQDLRVVPEKAVEVDVTNKRNAVVSACDLLVETCDGAVALLMELKVIHRSSLLSRKAGGLPADYIYDYLSNKLDADIVIADDILLSLPLVQGFKLVDEENNLVRESTLRNPVTVADMQNLALAQAERSRRKLKGRYDELQCFSVIMLGFQVLVRELGSEEAD